MRRLLCYKHHCEEFDNLPSAERHQASSWITVKLGMCELCNLPKGAELPASYIIIEGDPGHLRTLLGELHDRNYLGGPELLVRFVQGGE